MNNPLLIMPCYVRNDYETDLALTTINTCYETTGIYPLVINDKSPYQQGIDRIKEQVEILDKKKNEGFVKTINIGLRKALEDHRDAVLVNADLEFRWDGWLQALYDANADVAGALLLYPNGLIQHAGVYFSVITRAFDHIYRHAPGDLPAAQKQRVCPVTGALQLIKADTLQSVGIYDEDYTLGWDDVDYCLRVFNVGRKCVYTPACKAVHHESVIRDDPDPHMKKWIKESRVLLYKKHAGELAPKGCIPHMISPADL